jgi:hypothetical protein
MVKDDKDNLEERVRATIKETVRALNGLDMAESYTVSLDAEYIANPAIEFSPRTTFPGPVEVKLDHLKGMKYFRVMASGSCIAGYSRRKWQEFADEEKGVYAARLLLHPDLGEIRLTVRREKPVDYTSLVD